MTDEQAVVEMRKHLAASPVLQGLFVQALGAKVKQHHTISRTIFDDRVLNRTLGKAEGLEDLISSITSDASAAQRR
jgi:hypothetical protein